MSPVLCARMYMKSLGRWLLPGPCISLSEEHSQLVSLESAFLSSVNTASSFIQTVPREPGMLFIQEGKFPFGQGRAALGVHISGHSCVYP